MWGSVGCCESFSLSIHSFSLLILHSGTRKLRSRGSWRMNRTVLEAVKRLPSLNRDKKTKRRRRAGGVEDDCRYWTSIYNNNMIQEHHSTLTTLKFYQPFENEKILLIFSRYCLMFVHDSYWWRWCWVVELRVRRQEDERRRGKERSWGAEDRTRDAMDLIFHVTSATAARHSYFPWCDLWFSCTSSKLWKKNLSYASHILLSPPDK